MYCEKRSFDVSISIKHRMKIIAYSANRTRQPKNPNSSAIIEKINQYFAEEYTLHGYATLADTLFPKIRQTR
jgi:hypothetical protein